MSISRRAMTLAGTALLVMCSGFSARADDTEIFFATPPDSVNTRPNILFIMDTSGSMRTPVTDKVPYNPATSYAGNCEASRVYWKGSGDMGVPMCSGRWATDRYVSSGNLVCKSAADKLGEFGSWPIGPAAQYRTGANNNNTRWRPLRGGTDAYVECQADAAIGHGLVANDNKYATDTNGPFTTNQSQSITWTTDDTNDSYVFYSGNYLNWYHDRTLEQQLGTRLQIVQQTAMSTLDRLSNVNVGLMRFSSDADGGMVLYPLSAIESSRDALKQTIQNFNADGGTPLSETFLEAYQYLSGGNLIFGKDTVPQASDPTSYTGTGDLAQYRKPIQSACQKNFIVYLTDGDPTVDQDAEDTIEDLPNFSTLGNVTTQANNGGECSENGAIGNEGGGATEGDGKCLDDLAKYMNKKDFFDDTNLPPERDPVENVTTYTIGFGNGVSARGLALLQATADAGGGKFYEAGDSASLTEAFNNIIQDVLSTNVSFSAPAVSVNAFNRTQNLNDLFITVFKPTGTYHWPGNLKKYRLNPTDGTIRDMDGDVAVDDATGFFEEDARSFWLNLDDEPGEDQDPDGADVEKGGAANELPTPANRDLYTDLGALNRVSNELNDASNALADANTRITVDHLGIPELASADAEAAERTAVINWARGQSTTTPVTTRYQMGDPLHARPVSVIYGGTATAPEAVVFAATNDGYVHAFDPSDGSELWAYVPSDQLGRLYNLRQNAALIGKRYGMDGNLLAHRIDKDGDGTIESGDGDRVYLFFGMGRGGDNYYALDVTNKNAPKFMWRNGADFTMTGLGQSWSTPVLTQVLVGNGSGQNSDRFVLIVGGGYDPTQDAVTYNTDTIGNRLFMLDALSGSLLWTGGPSGANFNDARMTNSIPADVRVLDMTNDGLADRMYAADTGGRIWRFDIENGNAANSLVRGGVFASLGGAAGSGGTGTANARRFYSAPDVSLLRADNRFYVNIAIGSGYRGHPLNTEIQDTFYSLRDPRPFTAMTANEYEDWTPILHTDPGLIDVTTNVTPTIPAGAAGWKIDLRLPSWSGEKVLAEARTFAGAIIFPTFTPAGRTSTFTCTAQSGVNALYIVQAADGRPVLNRDTDATPSTSDRVGRLNQGGIAPPAAIFFPSPDNPNTCQGAACNPPPVCLVGVEDCGISFTNNPVRTFWSNDDVDVGE